MNRPPKHGSAIDSSPGAHSSQPSASVSVHGPRQYDPGLVAGWASSPALLPAALNQVIPCETALSTTWAIGPVPSPGPSNWAVSERLTICTPFDAK